MRKLSPKQQLNKILPDINDIYIKHGFTCHAEWCAPKYNFKDGCYLKLIRDAQQIEMQCIQAFDAREQEKIEYREKWSNCLIEVFQIINEYFDYTGSQLDYYELKLKNKK